jgi:HAMP domain-containing protein
MKSLLVWWYRFSLPQRGPDITPAERERTRYARLTSAFSLVIFFLSLLTAVYGVFTSINPAAPIIEVTAFVCVLISLVCNKLGFNVAAALLLLANTTIDAVGNLLTNPLDPVFVPILCALVVTVVLAGSLMPPIYALVVAGLNCLVIILLAIYQQHTPTYDQWLSVGYGSILIALPIALQLIVGIVTYVILGNLIATIRRADRAEEIVALQKEIVDYQRRRNEEREQLEAGIAAMAEVYAAIANGNLDARVPVRSESVLWQVAAPLNTLLSRAQQWKKQADQWERTLHAIKYVHQELQQGRRQRVPVLFRQPTETPIDLLLPEVSALSQQAYKSTQPRPFDSR